MNVKEFIKQNCKLFVIYLILFIICIIPLPYYINYSGGLISLDEKINIDNLSSDKISLLNLSYVSEIKATIPTALIAILNSNWDIYKKEKVVYENETEEEVLFRNKLLLHEANNNAIIYSYLKANKDIDYINKGIYVTYIDLNSDTDLKIGDMIISMNDQIVKNLDDVKNVILNSNINDEINIKVMRNKKEINTKAKVYFLDNKKVIGVLITEDKEIIATPNITLNFDSSESGPSGGLMMSLGIYSLITDIDITKNRIIAGTGTIDINGNVGSISGVKYKLSGAIKNNSDIFIVPNGENYKEALLLKEKNDYNIDIVGVDNFDDALNYLLK